MDPALEYVVRAPTVVMTGKDGRAEIDAIPSSTVWVAVSHDGFSLRTTTMQMPARGSATEEMVLAPETRFRGTVVSRAGQPIVGIAVEARLDGTAVLASARTDGRGRFNISIAARHDVVRLVATRGEARAQIEWRAGDSSTIELVLD